MKSIVGASYIREGKLLVGKARDSESFMIGRVINIKFIRKSGNTFTIRSDYEPRFYNNGGQGTVEFVPCTQKPSITISYRPLANTVSTEVKIRVDSLFIDREATGEAIDAASEDPVTWALVQLGYIDQFPDWRKVKDGDDLERFYDLDNNSITTEKATLGGKQMLVQILNCGPESLPPERTWLFNGVIGTLENGLKWGHKESALLLQNYGDPNTPAGMSEIESVLYQWVTRRFIRSSVQHRVSASNTIDRDGATVYKRKVEIYQLGRYKSGSSDDKTWTALDLETNLGILSNEDASLFGVTCRCSEFLKNNAVSTLYYYGTIGKALKDANMQAPQSRFAEPFDGLGPQLEAIRQHYPFLRWYMLHDGTFFFYHVEESVDGIFSDPFVNERQEKYAVLLPAVYDITNSGMRIIRCPFTDIIDPMTTVFFSSRYNILDLIGFYAQPENPLDAFLVLIGEVVFSTVGDENTMTLKCVDCPPGLMPVVNIETGTVTVEIPDPKAQTYTDKVPEKERETLLSWSEVTVTIGEPPFDKAQSGWLDIVNSLLLKNMDGLAWEGTTYNTVRALYDLREWNSGLWTTARLKDASGRSSPENRLAPNAGAQIPWLFKGDKVVVRLPYRPSYEDKYKKPSVKV